MYGWLSNSMRGWVSICSLLVYYLDAAPLTQYINIVILGIKSTVFYICASETTEAPVVLLVNSGNKYYIKYVYLFNL
jgi:hypothetical protein